MSEKLETPDEEMFEEAEVLTDEDRQGDEENGANDGEKNAFEGLDELIGDEFAKVEAEEAKAAGDPADVKSLTEALSRERADFLNYKTRANKDIERARGFGKRAAVEKFYPVVDEIDRARANGDVDADSPFGKITAKLEDAFKALGWEKYAAKGDAFDPAIHDALMNREAGEGDEVPAGETLVDQVVEAGYRFEGEVVRHAKVTTVAG